MATIKGKWVFNDVPKGLGNAYEETGLTFDFISNGINYKKIWINEAAQSEVFYIEYDNTEVYTQENGWLNETYRSIDFGNADVEAHDIFYNWITANATQRVEEGSTTVTVTYNDNVIAIIEGGQTATLNCAGKKMASDISITAPEVAEAKLQEKTITENGEITPDEGYDGFSKVIVDVPIPDGYIIPTGTKEITENGTYDVTEFANTNVNIPIHVVEVYDGMVTISDGGYDHNAPELHPSGTIPENATYKIRSTSGTYTTLNAGEAFPETISEGDTYTYGDYEYMYKGYMRYDDNAEADVFYSRPEYNGWNVSCINKEIVTPEPILESINGANVTMMYEAFYGCTLLTTAPAIPNSVTNMECTFEGCTSLTTAPIIPNSVTNMEYTFNNCTSLKTYIGAPEGIVDGDFSGYVIPEGLSDMNSTFKNCTSLTTAPDISNANSVTNMYMTFYGCTSLTTAPVIPNSVTSMNSTFDYCSSLKTYVGAPEGTADGDFSGYVIPEGVTSMSSTFDGCTSLTTAPVIPEGVTLMNNTFNNCTSLSGTITINATPTNYTKCLKNTQITEILGDCGNKEAILATK